MFMKNYVDAMINRLTDTLLENLYLFHIYFMQVLQTFMIIEYKIESKKKNRSRNYKKKKV